MDWNEAIRLWRALPEEEQRRRRLASIPLKVVRSCAFEGEPVDLAMLEAEHARRPMPIVAPKPAMRAQAPDAQFMSRDGGDEAHANALSLGTDRNSTTKQESRTARGLECFDKTTVKPGNN